VADERQRRPEFGSLLVGVIGPGVKSSEIDDLGNLASKITISPMPCWRPGGKLCASAPRCARHRPS